MYVFSPLLSIVAFFLAFLAYLSIGSALRHAERQNAKYVAEHIEAARKEMEHSMKKIEAHNERLLKFNVLIDGTLDSQKRLKIEQNSLRESIKTMQSELQTLDNIIPQKYKLNKPKALRTQIQQPSA